LTATSRAVPSGVGFFRFAGVQVKRLQCATIHSILVYTSVRIQTSKKFFEEIPLSKIARRKFIQLSAAAAAGCFMQDSRKAMAQDLPHLTGDDPMAQAMKYTDDASSVDPGSRANPAEDQTCANCALVQGDDGAEWRPCQIFPGKAVNAAGWCSVWAPKP
jgi:hypothetical protein